MLFGPVFEVEAKLASRKRRVYATRALYGLAMLAFAAYCYEDARISVAVQVEERQSYRVMARVGASVFWETLSFQCVAVFAMTPALVAGAVANDRQRGILINLLASPLTSREIVLGKLAARTFLAFMLVFVGLPILAILSLLGGIEPEHLFLSFLATGSLLWFLAAVSILISVHARKARDAVFVSYVFVAVWLLAPLFLRPLLTIWWPGLQPYGMPFLRAMELSSPFNLAGLVSRPVAQGRTLYLLVALECLGGILAAGLATWRLRGVSAESDRGVGSAPAPTERLRIFRRPPCGDDPMMWKELRVARLGRIARRACWLVGLPLGLLVVETSFDHTRAAFREVAAEGYGWTDVGTHQERDRFNRFLRENCSGVLMVWLVAVATTAAGSVTSEREEDTWISLRSTPLSGAEILRAKRWGAIRRFAPLGLMLTAVWTLGLVTGAVHPLAFPLVVLDLVVMTLFVAALGILFSVVASNSTRAVVMTIAALLATNLAMYLLAELVGRGHGSVGLMPAQPAALGLADEEVRRMVTGSRGFRPGPALPAVFTRTAVVVMILHAAAIPFLVGVAESALAKRERPSRRRTEQETGEGGDG